MKRWHKRLLLAFPFAVAGALNVLMWTSDRYHWPGLRMTYYAFLFAMPWARLLGEIWLPNPRSHILQLLLGYVMVLWIPAALYYFCLWIIVRVIQGWVALFAKRQDNEP